MKEKKDKILLVTKNYPFGGSETFIENEINYLGSHYEQVIIVPVNANREIRKSDSRLKDLPSNIKVLEIKESDTFQKGGFIKPFFSEIKHLKTARKLVNRENLRLFLGGLRTALRYVSAFEKIIRENKLQNCVAYSYWGDFWLVPLLLIKDKYQLKVISRMHGYDVYTEVHPNNYFPFKPFILQNLDGVYPISDKGVAYLNQRYSINGDDKSFYLGIKPHEKRNPFEPEKGFVQIVSCAGMREVKRIDKLIDGLALLGIEVKWDHMGDGTLRAKLEEKANALPSNITYCFHGNVSNAEVHQFYQTKPVDVFINTSSSEGIPVSIMEALSYGIPVFAPNVGGIGEIVIDSYNGVLFEEKVAALEVKEAIEKLEAMLILEIENLRSNARKKWEDDFDASKNYPEFIQHIKQL